MVNPIQSDYIDSLKDSLEHPEPLCEELKPFLDYTDGIGWKAIKHPLFYQIFYEPKLNKIINESFRQKKEYAAKKLADGNYGGYVFLHEQPYRFPVFQSVASKFTDQDYWECLSFLLRDTENQWQEKGRILKLLQSKRPGREFLMTPEDRDRLSGCDDPITIYRGHQKRNQSGLSWTLNGTIATFFATRYLLSGETGLITTAKVIKKDVIALFEGIGEEEVLVDPRKLAIVSTVEIIKEV